MKFTRIYADEYGESHFEDVEVNFDTIDFAPPAPPLGVSQPTPAQRYRYLRGPAGWVGDWHPAPERHLMIYLSGEVEAETSDGEIRRFGPGSVILLEDTFGRGHRSRVLGLTDVLVAVVQLDVPPE